MALKPWHRAGLTAAGMALAAVIVLPPRTQPQVGEPGWRLRAFVEGSVSSYWQSGARFERTLSGTASGLRILARAARLTDSLFALTSGPRTVRSVDRAVTVIYTSAFNAESARVWLGMIERELALAPRGAGGGMPVVVRLRVASREHSLPRRGEDFHLMRFVSPRSERQACFVDVLLRDPGTRDAERIGLIHRPAGVARTHVLDWCMLYARFGAPGAQVERWAGRRAEVRYYWSFGPDLAWALDAQRSRAHGELAGWWSDKFLGACSQRGGPCLRLLGLVADPTGRWEGYPTVNKTTLLAGLMLQDSARFQQFWRSPAPPAVALEQAYGRPAGVIVADYQREVTRPEQGGPRAPAGALLSSLGWAVIAIGLGLLVAWRQQVR